MSDSAESVPVSDIEDGNENDELVALRGGGRYFGNVDDVEYLGPVCRNCHKRGHMAAKCKVTVCQSCGMVDDHDTRQCPRLQRCSNCGQIGHLWTACTSEHQAIKCSQCGARTHRDENCLLIWREYKYDMDSRPEYPINVSCYNCASTTHYGDECNKPRPVELRYREGSAFSGYNMSKQFLSRYRRDMDAGLENEKRESSRSHSRSHKGSGSNGSSKKSKRKDGSRKDDYKAQMKHSEHKHREKMQNSGNPLRKRINNMKKRR